MSFAFDHPEYLWLLLFAGPIIYLGMRSLRAMNKSRRWCAIGLRLLVLVLVVLMLAGFQTVRKNDVMTVIAVLDQSESVRKFAKPPAALGGKKHDRGYTVEQWQERLVRAVSEDRRPDDLLSVISYADRPIVRALPSKDPVFGEAIQIDTGSGTDTAAAIRTAIAQARSDSSAKILLCSDLNDIDSEEVLAAARDAAVAGIPISVAPVPYSIKNEVIVKAVHVPMDAREGQSVRVRVELEATDPTRGELFLMYDDQVVPVGDGKPGLDVNERDWVVNQSEEGRGQRQFVALKRMDVPLGHTGVNHFKAVFTADYDDAVDRVTANNEAESFTIVRGQGKVLFVDGLGGESGMVLPRTLMSHGIDLEVIIPSQLPGSVRRLQKYDAVIFQSVPVEYVSASQQRALATYVHDMGGGFAMIGGRGSFGAGGWTNSVIDKTILPVACQIPTQTLMPSGALVLVIDHSGSMASPVIGSRYNQQVLANEAAILAMKTLYPQDLVGVVVFDDYAKWAWDIQMNSDTQKLAKRVRAISPGGGTNIFAGLETAHKKLAPLRMQDAAIKHIILLTDGNSQEGKYVQLIGNMMKSGITLSTVGIGDARQFGLLQRLANMGGGQYHDVKDPNDLPQVFIKEAQTIRKNLIKEVGFAPVLRDADSPLITGFSASPELRGYVLTGEKQDPRIFVPLVAAEGEPLLAHMQTGLGRSVAFTSDATNRWAVDWLAWGGYEDFWVRLVRYIARPSQNRMNQVMASVEGEHVRLRLDAGQVKANGRRSEASFQNDMIVEGAMLQPDGSVQRIRLDQVGPGMYETDVPAEQVGNYIIELQMTDKNGSTQRASTGATRLPGEELRRFKTNLPLAEQVALITGGDIINPADEKPESMFTENRPETYTLRSVWRYLLIVLLIAFFMDVANRRIAWDPDEMAHWYRKRKAAKAARAKRATEQTISSLKNRRDKASEGMQADDDELAKAALTVEAMYQQRKANTLAERRKRLTKSRTSKRKFEANETQSASKDFVATMGGAQIEENKPIVQNAKSETQAEMDSDDMTSRLLSAKKKAQQRLDDIGNDKE
ncbi:von Willebrand factor type A domain protein [Poriferisphaera corsica]|uniref:von Willebrand factor type A domain protein n=1 Tax=Poriferisphaera corsica TaxID=2528020 RepID=A0A517YR06_9BACT|nr:VWA domain-containing protein [Poriferisphaera corsica]QDU32653.1 von Willebrand factor type A domain protein [Poriferisphaera corsica]